MGKTVENYLILEPLGEGNFSKVFKAKNMKTGQDFAIKVIPSQKFKDIPKLEECTVNEINILSQLRNQSEHIVNYVDMLKTNNNFYFVYEFCNGGTLDRLIQKDGYLSQQRALRYLRQILDAFKVLNRHSIMHRDLKPQNILIHNGNIKIADFSFCKLLENKNDLTQTMLGSPIYMAPEVLKGQIYTIKADIWSMGIVLYKMLFGKCPYESKSIALLIKLLEKQDLEIPSEPKISPATEEFLRKVIVKEPNERLSWDDIFNTYVITEQGEIINRRQQLNQQQQQQAELRLSMRGTVNNGGPIRTPYPNVPGGNLQMPNNGYNGNPMSLTSPKSIQVSQPYINCSSGVISRTAQTTSNSDLNSPQFDRSIGLKKSPFKQESKSAMDFRSSTNFGNQNQIIQSNYSINRASSGAFEPSSFIPNLQTLSTASENGSFRVSHQNSMNSDQGPRDRINERASQRFDTTRLGLTRADIFTKNHMKCLQVNQMALEIFALDQTYANYVCYFLFKNICKEIESLNENLKKESVADSNIREFRSVIEAEMANIQKVTNCFYEAIVEEDKDNKILNEKLHRSLDDQLADNKQRILQLYIENLNDSDEHIRIASQVVDYLEESILIKRDAYERMSREHLYKQMRNKVFKQ